MTTPVEVRVGDSLFRCESVHVEWQRPVATLASPLPVPGGVVITCEGAVEYTPPPFRRWTNDTGPKTCADCSHEQTCERSRRRQCGEAKLGWVALSFDQMRARKLGPWAEPTETPEAGASAEDEAR